MDPRQQRTADALRVAILEIATEQPIDRVQVAEIARRAGITRATFYNQSMTPAALLTSYLAEELDLVRQDFQERVDLSKANLAQVWASSERELVEHLRRNAAIYERDIEDSAGRHLGPTLRNFLYEHIETGLREHLDAFPQLVPDANELDRHMYAAFVAQGSVGAFEIWLRSPEPRDSDVATRAIMQSLPSWWFTPQD